MNTDDVQTRLTEATSLNGAKVEVQHPGAPWNSKIVIRMFVDDDSAEAVAENVREVAAFAADEPSLDGQPLTLMAIVGTPDDFPNGDGLSVAGVKVMGSVSRIVGGVGTEEILELSAADVRRLADE
ncbi:MAG: hypothetical protein QM602_03325 [Microbacterium sp.]